MGEWVLWGFCLLTMFWALGVLFSKNPIGSALSLVVVFFCIASIYALLSAHFLAVIQLVVYAGAVMVLFLFGVMLLNLNQPENDIDFGKPPSLVSLLFGLGTFLFLVMGLWKGTSLTSASGEWTTQKVQEAGGNVEVLSSLLFSKYLIAFEGVSLLILVAIIGAVLLAKRRPSV